MEELLPREILWADKKTMKEFLCEPLNQKIFEVYLNIKREGIDQDYQTLKLFNEVYYQCSRIVNIREVRLELIDVIYSIKNDLGWDYSSSLVINIIYVVLSLRKDNQSHVKDLIKKIEHHYQFDKHTTPFSKLVNDCVENDEYYKIEFQKPQFIFTTKTPHLTVIYIINKVDQFNAILGNNPEIIR
jgi:hypothetical protein